MTEKKTEELTLRGKLVKAMGEMQNPTKSKTAEVPTKKGTYTYNYESLDQVLEAIRPALTNNGIGLTQGLKYDAISDKYILETIVFDERESMTLDTRPMRSYDRAQEMGSWETYMRRYALRAAFGLTGEDDDGAAASNAKPYGDVMKGAKVTEMASDKQMNMIYAKLNELADLRGVSKDDAEAALIASKTMNGADMDNLTKQQASNAITLLVDWIAKANNYDELDVYGTSSFEGGQDKA